MDQAQLPQSALTKPARDHTLVEVLLSIIIILLIGFIVVYVLHVRHSANTTLTNTTSGVYVPADTWTGKGKTPNFSDAANWSRGVPANGKAIIIDVSKIPGSNAQTTPNSQIVNDLANHTFSTITFSGSSNRFITMTGNPFTLAGDIIDKSPSSSSSQIAISNDITLAKNAVITVSSPSSGVGLYFGSKNAINVADKSLSLVTTGKSQIYMSASVTGTGELNLTGDGTDLSIVVDGTSPGFSGKTNVVSGVVDSAANAFGTSTINVATGANWSIVGTGTTSATVTNPLFVAGSGVANTDGGRSGAISACLTAAQQGCSPSQQVMFTGPVKLTADTQIGASSTKPGTPVHVGYNFSQLNKADFTLTVVSDSQQNIQF